MNFAPSREFHNFSHVPSHAQQIRGDLEAENGHASEEEVEECQKNSKNLPYPHQMKKYNPNELQGIQNQQQNLSKNPQSAIDIPPYLSVFDTHKENNKTEIDKYPISILLNTSTGQQNKFHGTSKEQILNEKAKENIYGDYKLDSYPLRPDLTQLRATGGCNSIKSINYEQPSSINTNIRLGPSDNYGNNLNIPFNNQNNYPMLKEQKYQQDSSNSNFALRERDENTYNFSRANDYNPGNQLSAQCQQKQRHLSPKHQEKLFQRLNNEAKVQQETKQLLAQIQEQKQMEECTFAPQLTQNDYEPQDNFQNKRSLQKFLEDQNKHQVKQAQKINLLKNQATEALNEELSHQPKINHNSEIIASKKREANESVHERLYKIASKTTSDSHNESTFLPQINEKSKMMTRKGNVDENLYADALRRIEKCNVSELEKLTERTNSSVHTIFNGISEERRSKNEEIVASRFVKEFEKACDQIMFDQMSQRIDYLQAGEILKKLKFLSDSEGNAKERKLLYDLWWHLRGDQNQFITKCSLCQFLLVVLGIFGFQLKTSNQVEEYSKRCNTRVEEDENEYKDEDQEEVNEREAGKNKIEFKKRLFMETNPDNLQYQDFLTNQEDTSNNNNNTSNISCKDIRKGQIDSLNNWSVSIEEGKTIQKYFEVFYRNKLSCEELRKSESKAHLNTSNSDYNNQFQPQILENSKRLAEVYREKLLEETAALIENEQINVKVPENGKITHVDLLLYQKQAQMNERKRRMIEQQNLVEEECTFHPQTLQSQQSSIARTSTSGTSKSIQLYQLAKQNPKSIKQDKNKNDLEYERDADQCTFKPDTTLSKQISRQQSISQLNATSIPALSSQDKAIQRMRAANKQREEKNILLSRGYKKPTDQDKNNKNNLKPVSSRLYNEIPLHKQSQVNKKNQETTQHHEFIQYQNGSSYQEETQQQQQHQEVQELESQMKEQLAINQQPYSDYQQQVQEYNLSKQSQQQQGELLQQQLVQFTHQQQKQEYQSRNIQQQRQEQPFKQWQKEMPQENKIVQKQEEYLHHHEQQQDQQQQSQQQQFGELRKDNMKNDPPQKFSATPVYQAHPFERIPLLFVDVNLGSKSERIIVFDGDTSEELSHMFAKKHCTKLLKLFLLFHFFIFEELDEGMQVKLKELLDFQISSLLTKIDEEECHSMISEGPN